MRDARVTHDTHHNRRDGTVWSPPGWRSPSRRRDTPGWVARRPPRRSRRRRGRRVCPSIWVDRRGGRVRPASPLLDPGSDWRSAGVGTEHGDGRNRHPSVGVGRTRLSFKRDCKSPAAGRTRHRGVACLDLGRAGTGPLHVRRPCLDGHGVWRRPRDLDRIYVIRPQNRPQIGPLGEGPDAPSPEGVEESDAYSSSGPCGRRGGLGRPADRRGRKQVGGGGGGDRFTQLGDRLGEARCRCTDNPRNPCAGPLWGSRPCLRRAHRSGWRRCLGARSPTRGRDDTGSSSPSDRPGTEIRSRCHELLDRCRRRRCTRRRGLRTQQSARAASASQSSSRRRPSSPTR